MTLKNCLEIGIECGLPTVGECIFNIDMHAMNIFEYSKITEEINQIISEANEIYNRTNFTKDSSAKDLLTWINIEDDGINTEDLNL